MRRHAHLMDSIHSMCLLPSLHLLDWSQDTGHMTLSTAVYITNPIRVHDQIIVLSVRCDDPRVSAFLICRLWGWTQGLITLWSGAPEPVLLEGTKGGPPAGQQVPVHMSSAHARIIRLKIDPLLRRANWNMTGCCLHAGCAQFTSGMLIC